MSQGKNSEKDLQQLKTKHKIQLCRAYSEIGNCPYGQICMFAHGIQQLCMYQPAVKVKTCRNFHYHGYCRFGERCNFRHEKNVKMKNKNKNKEKKYSYFRAFNGYADLLLAVQIQIKNFQSKDSFKAKCTETSQSSSLQ